MKVSNMYTIISLLHFKMLFRLQFILWFRHYQQTICQQNKRNWTQFHCYLHSEAKKKFKKKKNKDAKLVAKVFYSFTNWMWGKMKNFYENEKNFWKIWNSPRFSFFFHEIHVFFFLKIFFQKYILENFHFFLHKLNLIYYLFDRYDEFKCWKKICIWKYFKGNWNLNR